MTFEAKSVNIENMVKLKLRTKPPQKRICFRTTCILHSYSKKLSLDHKFICIITININEEKIKIEK